MKAIWPEDGPIIIAGLKYTTLNLAMASTQLRITKTDVTQIHTEPNLDYRQGVTPQAAFSTTKTFIYSYEITVWELQLSYLGQQIETSGKPRIIPRGRGPFYSFPHHLQPTPTRHSSQLTTKTLGSQNGIPLCLGPKTSGNLSFGDTT